MITDEATPNARPRAEIKVEAPEKEAIERIGQVVGGKYRLQEILGSGGMAHVYRAVHETIGRGVAIKILRKQFTFEQTLVSRFVREAKTANSVHHPNVVSVIDVGTTDDGCPYLVQELLEGETLLQYVQSRGPLELKDVVELICPVIGAVAEAHASGVIHRDIKPENVFLAGTRGKRVPKLLDFGISKAMNGPSIETTAAGVVMGTPAYMAPELARAAKDADARSDVWSCGVMLFEALTGKVPFEGETVPMMFLAIATKDAARLIDVRPDIPPSLSNIVAKCLKRDPAERYPTATELARDLNAALDPKELALMTKPARRAPPPASSSPQPAAKREPVFPKTLKMEAVRPEPPPPADSGDWLAADHTLPLPTSGKIGGAPVLSGLRAEETGDTEPAMRSEKPFAARPPPPPSEPTPPPPSPVVSIVDDPPSSAPPALPSDIASIRRAPTSEELAVIAAHRKREAPEPAAKDPRKLTYALIAFVILALGVLGVVASYIR